MTPDSEKSSMMNNESEEFVTVRIADQLFGLPIEQVQDVFIPEAITSVPLSSPEIAGVLNLRGRIVTAIDMRRRLNLPAREDENPIMAVGIDHNDESFGLIIDSVGEVLRLSKKTFEKNPGNLDLRWVGVSAGIQRLENELMVILDVDKVLETQETHQAA